MDRVGAIRQFSKQAKLFDQTDQNLLYEIIFFSININLFVIQFTR